MIRLRSKTSVRRKKEGRGRYLDRNRVNSFVVYINKKNEVECAVGGNDTVYIIDCKSGKELEEIQLSSRYSNTEIMKILTLPKLGYILVPTRDKVHVISYNEGYKKSTVKVDVNNHYYSTIEICVVDEYSIAYWYGQNKVRFHNFISNKVVGTCHLKTSSIDYLLSNPRKSKGRIIGINLEKEVLFLIDCVKFRILRKMEMKNEDGNIYYLDSCKLDHKFFDTFTFSSSSKGLSFFSFRDDEEPYVEYTPDFPHGTVMYSHGKNTLLLQKFDKEDRLVLSHQENRLFEIDKNGINFTTYSSVVLKSRNIQWVFIYCANVYEKKSDQILCFEYNETGEEMLNEDFIERVGYVKNFILDEDDRVDKGIQYFRVGHSLKVFKILL